jgi:hypothetical protein
MTIAEKTIAPKLDKGFMVRMLQKLARPMRYALSSDRLFGY